MRSVAVLAALLLVPACGNEIVHGLGETQANQVVAALAEQGVAAEKGREEGAKGDRWTVTVPADDRTRALAVMRENGLPRSSGRGLADVFPKSSLIPTPTEERAMMMQAVMGELERTLETIDGVTLARVHVVIPPGAEVGLPRGAQSSAAVLLKTRPGSSVDRAAVRRLVARGVEGLVEERVTVEVFEGAPRGAAAGGAVSRVGPFLVHPASAWALRIAVACTAAVIAVMGVALAAVVLKLRGRGRAAVAGDAA